MKTFMSAFFLTLFTSIFAPILAPVHVWAQERSDWQLVYSSNINGELKPCGCSAEGNLGGLLRRATKLEQLRKQNPNTLTVSAGDILDELTEQGAIKNRYLLEGVKQLTLNAILPGERELTYTGFENSKLPWVLTNSTSYQSIPRHREVRLLNGRKILIFGVVDPALIKSPIKSYGAKLKDPENSLSQILDRLNPESTDTILVLVHGSPSLTKLISRDKRINILVQGHLDKPVRKSLDTGVHGQAILSAGHRGQRIGLATFDSNSNGKLLSNNIISLPENIADHPSLSHLYSQYDAEVIKWFREKTLAMKKKLKNTTRVFSSDKVCARCHQAIHRQWKKSRHARAYHSLVKAGKNEDPECLICHTTGMGKNGGFISQAVTNSLVNVQCESCHGATRKHAEYPVVHKPWKAMSACKNCHTPENSPAFDLKIYWPKIAHNQKTNPPIHKQSISRIKGFYDLLDSKRPALTHKQIEVTEYFNFYCSRCYILNRSWSEMVEFLSKPVIHKQVPVIFGENQKSWASIAWLAAEAAGKGESFKRAVFKAKFEEQKDIGDKNILIAIASKYGIEKSVRQALASTGSNANTSFRQGMKTKRYNNVTVTPTIIINRNLRVLPSHTGNNTELLLENVREILLDMQCRQFQACDL